jgi:hypothetical protein
MVEMLVLMRKPPFGLPCQERVAGRWSKPTVTPRERLRLSWVGIGKII